MWTELPSPSSFSHYHPEKDENSKQRVKGSSQAVYLSVSLPAKCEWFTQPQPHPQASSTTQKLPVSSRLKYTH